MSHFFPPKKSEIERQKLGLHNELTKKKKKKKRKRKRKLVDDLCEAKRLCMCVGLF
jgi:hypothetical protein